MKILALVASQDSTVEAVKTNGRRQMQALIGKDKECFSANIPRLKFAGTGNL